MHLQQTCYLNCLFSESAPRIGRILASAILTVIALIVTKSLWFKEGVYVQFNYVAQKDLVVQFFYGQTPETPFTEGSSKQERIQKGLL